MADVPVISLQKVHKQFPGVYALRDVDFDLHAGEVHALVGENGAGKSTLIKILSGVYDYQQGTLIIDVVDPETQRIAWRGWAVGPNRDGYYDEERVLSAVQAILGKFPPEVASSSAAAGSED